ncbi:MAG: c-type cytochrome [Thiotrichales bacterium]
MNIKKVAGIVLLAICGGTPLFASDTSQRPAWTAISWETAQATMPAGNVERGQELAQQGYCYSCHGDEGKSLSASAPSLAGQNPVYIYKTMIDFSMGLYRIDHKDDVMVKLAETLTKQDYADLAAFYAAKPLPKGLEYQNLDASMITPEIVRLVRKGDYSRNLTACASCHNAGGQGGKNEVPAIAGLHPIYFERAMKAFHLGTRSNDVEKGMRLFAEPLSDEEIQGLAQYYAHLVNE